MVRKEISKDANTSWRRQILLTSKLSNNFEFTVNEEWVLKFEFGQRRENLLHDDFGNLLADYSSPSFMVNTQILKTVVLK